MKILILHRIPYIKIDYARGVDHEEHSVVYVGTKEALKDIPMDLSCEKRVRPGESAVWEEVLDCVKAEEKFDRVISLSEYELLDAARVRESLGVSGPNYSDVLSVRDKLVMKRRIQNAGLRVPVCSTVYDFLNEHSLLSTEESAVVLKPRCGASSEGVVVFKSASDLRESLEKNTDLSNVEESFEVEEYVDGPILHIDGLVREGELLSCMASRYIGNCLGYAQGEPLGSVQIPLSKEIFEFSARCLEAVSIADGAFHLELIESDEGLVFLEVANRVGGADVVDCYEMATGLHLPSEELKIYLGESDLKSNIQNDWQKYYSWFVFPAHIDKPHYRSVLGDLEWLGGHPFCSRFHYSPSARSGHITYQRFEVPVSGVLSAKTSRRIQSFLSQIFADVSFKMQQLTERAA